MTSKPTSTQNRFPILTLLGKRLWSAIPILLGVIVVTFLMVHVLPGDPAAFFASSPNAGPAEVAALRHAFGLDKSLPEQFFIYVRGLFSGQLGISLVSGQAVTADIGVRLPATIELATLAFVMGCVLAIPLGVVAAVRQGSWVDHLCRSMTSVGAAIPTFFFGLLLILIFYFWLGIAPEPVGRLPAGMDPPPHFTGMYLIDGAIGGLRTGDWSTWRAAGAQILMPAASMAIFALAPLARMTRASMLGVLSSDFVRAGRALGLSRRRVLLRYALRNAMLPVLTTMGMVLSTMIGANVLVEKVFAWPGIGAYALDALISLDYAPVQGYILVVGGLFVVINLVIDVLYSVVDPRTRIDG